MNIIIDKCICVEVQSWHEGIRPGWQTEQEVMMTAPELLYHCSSINYLISDERLIWDHSKFGNENELRIKVIEFFMNGLH